MYLPFADITKRVLQVIFIHLLPKQQSIEQTFMTDFFPTYSIKIVRFVLLTCDLLFKKEKNCS